MATPITRFRFLFADDKSLYGITAAGELLWYPGWTDSSTPPNVDAGKPIGTGWAAFSHVFPGGDGILYAVTSAGELLWYRDLLRNGTNAADGSSGWAASSGSQIGSGWGGFATVFSGGGGLIYGITASGKLLWYRDLARDGSNSADGSTGWAAVSGSQIGTGWSGFQHLVSGGGGVIYAVTAKGDLLWYRDDRQDGSNAPDGSEGWAPESGATIGTGWDFFNYLFAGAAGEIFACHALEFGGTVRRYRDLLRDGTNTNAGGWLTSPAMAGGTWQIAAIEGYAWPPSVPAGGTVRLHVSATTPGRSTVSYRRLGGRGPRMGVTVGSGADFDCDFQAGGTFSSDCAWPVVCELAVPEHAPSWGPGIYSARVQGPSGPPFDIPFVVAREAERASLALLVNLNTWNAYNTWGGASNYTATANPVSLTLKRPNHHLLSYSQDHGKGNHMLRSEIWLYSWLRAQGFQVDLYTDLDLEQGIDGLADYKALVLNTHPEYWTQNMMAKVAEYLDAGRSLLYLGGNAMYRPSTMQAESAGGDLDLLVTHSDVWPQYPAYEGKPLLAARVDRFKSPGPRRGLRVSDPHHRFMPTGAAGGQVIGASGWNGPPSGRWGASGWETDPWADPLPDGVALLARDTTDVDGAAIACYETSSGGFVLGVGSITFVGALMDDAVLQQIVTNALAEALAKA